MLFHFTSTGFHFVESLLFYTARTAHTPPVNNINIKIQLKSHNLTV